MHLGVHHPILPALKASAPSLNAGKGLCIHLYHDELDPRKQWGRHLHRLSVPRRPCEMGSWQGEQLPVRVVVAPKPAAGGRIVHNQRPQAEKPERWRRRHSHPRAVEKISFTNMYISSWGSLASIITKSASTVRATMTSSTSGSKKRQYLPLLGFVGGFLRHPGPRLRIMRLDRALRRTPRHS